MQGPFPTPGDRLRRSQAEGPGRGGRPVVGRALAATGGVGAEAPRGYPRALRRGGAAPVKCPGSAAMLRRLGRTLLLDPLARYPHMNHRLSLAVAACVCLSVLGWILLSGDGPRETPAPAAGGGAIGATTGARAAELEGPGLSEVATSAAVERRAATAEATPTPIAAGAHPWAGQLAGVMGRIVEEDGTPVADLRVELLQVDTTLLLAPEATALGNPSLELDETRTGEDGRFVLDGAFVGAFHVLGVDRGGPRSTIRLVERALELGTRVDLGDIQLAGFGTLLGTVIDEDGEPVAGARVRVAPVPDLVVEVGVLDLRPESLIAVSPRGDDDLVAIAIPPLIGRQLDALPIPTTHTATDGTFRLQGVPLRRIVGGVDQAGYVAAVIPGTDMKSGELDLGELELVRGRAVTGIVRDAGGAPIVGAEVYAGVLQTIAPVGILQPAGVTDASGAFALSGVPEVGAVIGFARRAPTDAWVPARAIGAAERLEFVLPGAARLTVRVKDAAGEPVRGARLALRSLEEGAQFDELSRMTVFANARTPKVRPAVAEGEPGVYVCDAVSLGSWEVEVEADGLATARQRVVHGGDGSEVALVCGPGQRLTVRVLDAATGSPVVHAHASLIAPANGFIGALDAAFSDATGVLELGPFQPLGEVLADANREVPREVLLRVLHPRYGEQSLPVPESMTTVDVRLDAACSVVGRVHWGGATPDRSYMLFLTRENVDDLAEVFAVPRLGLTDDEGRFRFTSLAAGEYELHVSERFFDVDPLTLVMEQREPVMRHRVDVQVRPGEPTVVDVDLTPSGMGPTARLEGSVRANGAPVAGAVIEVNGAEKVTLTSDMNGEFRSGELSALRGVWVTVDGEVDTPQGARESRRLHQSWHELRGTEVTRIDVDVELAATTVLVVDRDTGAPVAGAAVNAESETGAVTTDGAGRATLVLDMKNGAGIQVSAEGYAQRGMHINASTPRDGGAVRVELGRPVPCSGRVVLTASPDGAQGWHYLHVQEVDGAANDGTQLEAEAGADAPFTLSNLTPGKYRAHVYCNGQQGEPIEFELGPGGATDLVFEFRPSNQDR